MGGRGGGGGGGGGRLGTIGMFFSHQSFSFFLTIFTGSLIHEHYTRECEFGNFDKNKKQKQHKKTNNTKKLKHLAELLFK